MKYDEVDFAEIISVTYGIIQAFKDRGYSLYSYGVANMTLPKISLEMIREIVSFGPEEELLEPGIKYLVLPLVVENQRSDPNAVIAAIYHMSSIRRAPFYVQLETQKDGSVIAKSVHLIDSIYIKSPFLYLEMDPNFASGTSGCIEIPLVEAFNSISKQLALASRDKPVQNKKTDYSDRN